MRERVWDKSFIYKQYCHFFLVLFCLFFSSLVMRSQLIFKQFLLKTDILLLQLKTNVFFDLLFLWSTLTQTDKLFWSTLKSKNERSNAVCQHWQYFHVRELNICPQNNRQTEQQRTWNSLFHEWTEKLRREGGRQTLQFNIMTWILCLNSNR